MTADTPPVLLDPSDGGKAKEVKKQISSLIIWEKVKTRKRSSLSRSRRHSNAFPFPHFPESKISEDCNMKCGNRSSKKGRLSAHTYKNLLKSRARIAEGSAVVLLQRRDTVDQEEDTVKCNGATETEEKVIDSNSSCLEMQRVGCDSISEPLNLGQNSSCISIAEVGVDFEAGLCLEHSEDAYDTQSEESQHNVEIGKEDILCKICMLGGDLLSCDGKECNNNFHLSCLVPPLDCAPPGVWHCIWCVQKKIQFGVYSVSEGIESILNSREMTDQEVQGQKQYLVNYKGLAHVHNCWIPEGRLLLEAPMLLSKYKKIQKKRIKLRWDHQWTIPQRLLQKRFLHFPSDGSLVWHNEEDSDCNYEWLVKWTGLGYENATWELANSAFMKSLEAIKLVESFNSRIKNTDSASHPSIDNQAVEATIPIKSELTSRSIAAIPDQYVSNIDKLRECWHRGKNAIVYDDQERAVKVILFLLSMQDDALPPFLVICTPESLSLWEAELSKHETHVNIVVYKGNSTVRAFIRYLEFFNDNRRKVFQIVLSTADIVVEDIGILLNMKWGGIIADECQRPKMYMHLEQMEKLPADMRILLVNGHIMERRASYLSLLSFLEPKQNSQDENGDDMPEHDFLDLKERLASFLAFECKPRTPSFMEYWVPVRLSNVQLEQYCDALLSNSTLLCSNSKGDAATSLPEILTFTRKCCNHPYLVDTDNSLRNRVTSCFPAVERLNVDIEVSGKLQILENFLLQVKEQGLRVLIIYQALGGSGPISTGDILDDFVNQRFGEDSYARIYSGETTTLTKQASMDMFNHGNSDMFVFLMESRACSRSIKLCSVDAVIFFDSDWDPLNDLKSLQKITITSQFEQVKVFRLYSSQTVEEKLLILAKQGDIPDGKTSISRRASHMLLSWGALHQLVKLDDFHARKESFSHSTITMEHSFIHQVVSELSSLLSSNVGNTDPPRKSLVLEVGQTEGVYPKDISLLGEVEALSNSNLTEVQDILHNEPPHVFWTNILEGRCPRWRFLHHGLKRRSKRSEYLGNWEEETEPTENASRKKNHKDMVDDTVDFAFPQPRLRKKRRRQATSEESHLAAHCVSRERAMLKARGTGPGVRQFDSTSIPVVREASASELIGTNLSMTQRLSSTARCRNEEQTHQQPASSGLPAASNGRGNMPANGSAQNHQNTASMPSLGTIAGENHLVRDSSVLMEAMPQSACSDPFQMELEKMKKDKEQAIKMHEDTKVRLKSECEKEMDEICKKYEKLLKDAESALLQKKDDVEAYCSKVYVNMLLAKAFTREYTNAEACQVNLPDLINEISQFCPSTISASPPPTTGPSVSPQDEDESFSSGGVHQKGGETTKACDDLVASPPMIGSPTPPSTPASMNKNRPEKSLTPRPIIVSDFDSLISQQTAMIGLEQSLSTPVPSQPPLATPATAEPEAVVIGSSPSLARSCLPVIEQARTPILGPNILPGMPPPYRGCEFRAPAPHLRRSRPF